MIIVLHQVQTYDSPSTIVDVIETESMEVYKDLNKHCENYNVEVLVAKYISEGKAKRVEFKDVLVETGTDYQQR